MCVAAAAGGTPTIVAVCIPSQVCRLHAAGCLAARPSRYTSCHQLVRVHCQRNHYCCCHRCCWRDQELTRALYRKLGGARYGCTTHSVQCGRRRHSARLGYRRTLRSLRRRSLLHRFLLPPALRAHARTESPYCARSFARGADQTCAAKPHRARRVQYCAAAAAASAAADALYLPPAVVAWASALRAAERSMEMVGSTGFG